MGEQKVSKRGIAYVTAILRTTARTVTQAAFWKIKHESGREEIHLKLGRYNRLGGQPELTKPRSELTLDPDELAALIKTLEENLEPFRAGAQKWMTLDNDLGQEHVEQLRALFANPDKRKLIEFLDEHDIVSADLVKSLDFQNRCRAVKELEAMLGKDLREQPWQDWFTENNWVLGSDFVRLLDERPIDVDHIADYLMQAYDGFLDLVEIKRPEGGLKFWSDNLDHGNYIPHPDLVKAITQASRYIFEVERETNSVKFLERLDGVRAIKPRCVLIFGRSSDWNDQQREAYRMLNAGYHNLTILTFDHVLRRAKRMLGLDELSATTTPEPAADSWDDIPF
jgi:Shedu protein SduA, C-terminal